MCAGNTLTQTDKEFFKLFGFLRLPGFFDEAEVAEMTAEYEAGLVATAPLFSAPIGLRGQINWSNMRSSSHKLANALDEGKLLMAAQALLSDQAVGVMSNGNCFSGKFTEWHCDTSISPLRSVKFAAYLDPVDGESGALRVIPGSHTDPWNKMLLPIGAKAQIGDAGNPQNHVPLNFKVPDVPAQICATRPGDLLAFDLRLWHASWNGSPRRRMLSFTYLDAPKTADEEQSLAEFAKQLGREALNRELRRQREWVKLGADVHSIPKKEPQYSSAWLEAAKELPIRRHWISMMKSWGMMEA
jgi:hypothetical protein